MGMRALTDERGVKVWRDDKAQYPRYSFSISKKNDKGEYDNFYMEIKFKKGLEEPDNGDNIIINDAFMSFNVWIDKEGKKKTSPYLMVMDYENLDAKPKDTSFIDVPEGVEEALPFK